MIGVGCTSSPRIHAHHKISIPLNHLSRLVSKGALLELRGMCKESFSLIEILKCKTPKSYNETRQPPVRLYLERGDNDCIFCLTLIYLFIISC